MEVKPRLIVGLGNQGKEYKTTYHNAGFLFIDYLKANPDKSSIADCRLAKNESYMNRSGAFVEKTLNKYKIKPEELIVVHDDSDIELGKYKISFGRGSAGHNGVQSIIDNLKTKNFWRLRIGIGKISNQKTKAGEFVLKKIAEKDLEILEKTFQSIFEKKQWKD
ncbi:MAG: aminoacyl-tRNA hydrolase [Patescibacteria group bacterium]